MTSIYILSDSEKLNRYKVGSHTGTLEKLKSRYITAIPTLVVNYLIETPNAKDVETKFKQIYVNERIKNSNGNTSEWVNMELHEIIGSLLAIFLNCNNIKVNGTTMIKQTENNSILKLPPPPITQSDLVLPPPITQSDIELPPPIIQTDIELPQKPFNFPPPITTVNSSEILDLKTLTNDKLRQLCTDFNVDFSAKHCKSKLVENLNTIPSSQIILYIENIKQYKSVITCYEENNYRSIVKHRFFSKNSILIDPYRNIRGYMKCLTCNDICLTNEAYNKFYVANKRDSNSSFQVNLSSNGVNEQITIRSWDGKDINQLDFIRIALDLFTEKTSEKQDVNLYHIYEVIHEYATKTNKYELINFNISNIKSVMTSLGYIIGKSRGLGIVKEENITSSIELPILCSDYIYDISMRI
jgi:hypothetical protein